MNNIYMPYSSRYSGAFDLLDTLNEMEFGMKDVVEITKQNMRFEFRDYFGYAIIGDIWDESKPSQCDESCNAED
jgi:hypothetical protein